MLILGIETSCDDTGVALYDSRAGELVAHAVHSQVAMHEVYGGVVPELASRDHVRRIVPLTEEGPGRVGTHARPSDGIGYTEGPGLAGALLVGASFAHGLALSLGVPAVGIHHLEGHLLSPLLSARRPEFPFLALLVSGGHTQLMRVDGVGRYELLGDTQDDAAGEAFDKTAQLLGLGYPGGPALSKLAERGRPGRYRLPRPMIASGARLQLLRPEDRRPDAREEREAGPGRPRARVRRRHRGSARREVRARGRDHRSDTVGRCRRRRRQPPAARGARCRGGAPRLRRVLSRARALHRQRRHDRLRRRATPAGWNTKAIPHVQCEAALGSAG